MFSLKPHLHDNLDDFWLGEERAEAEVAGPLLKIFESNIHRALLACSG